MDKISAALITRLKAELLKRKGSWREVQDNTGVDRYWIASFTSDKIAEPGFTKAHKLARYLGLPL